MGDLRVAQTLAPSSRALLPLGLMMESVAERGSPPLGRVNLSAVNDSGTTAANTKPSVSREYLVYKGTWDLKAQELIQAGLGE